jgi:flagellar motor switch protein FliM
MSDAAAAPSVRPYKFFDERRPTRAWLPTLERINERFAQYLRTALLQYLQPPLAVVPQFAIELIRHSDLIDRLATPSHLTLVALRPLPGAILIGMDSELVGTIVESRFGGTGRIPAAVSSREFTPIEHHSMRRVVERVLEQFVQAWRPVASFEPQILRHEIKPAYAIIASSTDLLIVSSFAVKIGNEGGRLTLAIPTLVLEPLHERLVSSIAERRPPAHDPRWAKALRLGVGRARTELDVELAAVEITVRDFLGLRPGSVVDIERPAMVTVCSHGQPLFRGRWGRHGTRLAVRVEERLAATMAGAPGAAADTARSADDER